MMIPTFLAITQTMFVSTYNPWGGRPAELEGEINSKIQTLESSINHDSQTLNVKDIKFPNASMAFVIYEITDKKAD